MTTIWNMLKEGNSRLCFANNFYFCNKMKKMLGMKRIILVLIGVALTVFSFALDNPKAVTMISYEQSYSDYDGTLALRNNTETPIENVAFQIIYLDMQGNQLDYKDFYGEVEIAPGMARKVDIPQAHTPLM